jgi:hypothetical protein
VVSCRQLNWAQGLRVPAAVTTTTAAATHCHTPTKATAAAGPQQRQQANLPEPRTHHQHVVWGYLEDNLLTPCQDSVGMLLLSPPCRSHPLTSCG